MPVTLRTRAAAAAAAIALALVPVLAVATASSAAAVGTPISLTVLVPLTVRPTAAGLIDSATLANDTAPGGVLSRQLDAVLDTPAVIGLDPMIIASIRVLGDSAPDSAVAWLDRLRSATNETFALAYADADLASLASVNHLDLAAPIGFDFALNTSNFGPPITASPVPAVSPAASASASPSASSTASPTASATPTNGPTSTPTSTPAPTPTPTSGSDAARPALPTSVDEVLGWAYTLKNIAWPSDDTVQQADLDPLAAAGYQDVVLSSTNVGATDSGLVHLGKLDGIVADAGISSLVREVSSAVGLDATPAALSRLNTGLAGIAAVTPGRTVVATLDRQWPLGALNLSSLFSDLAVQPEVNLAGLSDVLAGTAASGQLAAESSDAVRDAQLSSVIATVPPEASFATVAVTPNLVLEPRRLQLLSLLAVSWLRGNSDWSTEVSTYLSDSATLLSSVKIVRGSNLFVGAGSTNIPVTVSNALTVPVQVLVNVASTSSVLQVQKQNVVLAVEPESSNKAAIPVQALTNANNVVATVSITSSTGAAIGFPDYVNVDLQPGWESLGTTVIVVLLVLIFGGGIARNIYKRRAARKARALAHADARAEPPVDAPAEAPRD